MQVRSSGKNPVQTMDGITNRVYDDRPTARDLQTRFLPASTHAIDTAVCVATGVMTDRSTRHRTGPEDDAGPRHATGRIADVLAVYDRIGWRWIESETSKPQQGAGSNAGNCR